MGIESVILSTAIFTAYMLYQQKKTMKKLVDETLKEMLEEQKKEKKWRKEMSKLELEKYLIQVMNYWRINHYKNWRDFGI